MDVRMPDGTVVRNVPDNITQSELNRRYSAFKATAAPAAAPQQEGSFLGDLGRAAVATTRDYAQGALGLAALPVDAAYGVWNLATGRNDMNASQALELTLDQAGIPKTENPYIRRINMGMGGAASGIGAGRAIASSPNPVTAGVGNTMAAAPAQQAGGAVGGALASQGVADMGGGPVLQGLAGLGGGVIGGGLLRQGVVEGIKRSFRGDEAGRQNLAGNIRLFEEAAGRTPSVGQGTQNRRMQGAESLLSRTPGGAGVMAREGAALADDVAGSLERQAGKLSPNASPEQAGRMILNKISGDGGFVENFKATQGQLYDKLDTYIPADGQVSVTNTRQALAALNQEIKNAPNLSKWFQNSRIKAIEEALAADTALPPTREVRIGANGTSQVVDVPTPPREWMPYESIKKIRTLVGNEMADAGLMSDVPRSKWKALYAALSRDLEGAATAAGPEARQAWSRANTFTRAGMARLDSIAHVLDKAGGPEKVYRAALSGTDDGATTLRAVMQSLPKEGQQTISATVLRRLGRATAGNQDAAGDVFSTETFLTNWNKLSPQAKSTLFDRYGAGFRQDMDKVARVAENLRSGSQVFRNPSGTAQAAIQQTTVGGFVVAVLTGQAQVAGGIAAGAGAANGAARLLTHPPFVKWLATTTQRPVGALPASLNQLAQSKDPLLQEAAALLSSQQANQPQQ